MHTTYARTSPVVIASDYMKTDQERLALEVEEALVPSIHTNPQGGPVLNPQPKYPLRWKTACGLWVASEQLSIVGRRVTCEECLRG